VDANTRLDMFILVLAARAMVDHIEKGDAPVDQGVFLALEDALERFSGLTITDDTLKELEQYVSK